MKLDVTFIKKKKKKITYLPTLFLSDLVSGNTQFFFRPKLLHATFVFLEN